MKNTKNTRRETREITRGKHKRNTQLTRTSHTCARSSGIKGKIHDPKSTTDDTR